MLPPAATVLTGSVVSRNSITSHSYVRRQAREECLVRIIQLLTGMSTRPRLLVTQTGPRSCTSAFSLAAKRLLKQPMSRIDLAGIGTGV